MISSNSRIRSYAMSIVIMRSIDDAEAIVIVLVFFGDDNDNLFLKEESRLYKKKFF